LKKKTREIVVEKAKYIWLVREDDFPQHTLKIWNNGKTKHPICELSFCILSEFSVISPKIVRAVIEKVTGSYVNEKTTIQIPLIQVYEAKNS
jgi:hypothetical protein